MMFDGGVEEAVMSAREAEAVIEILSVYFAIYLWLNMNFSYYYLLSSCIPFYVLLYFVMPRHNHIYRLCISIIHFWFEKKSFVQLHWNKWMLVIIFKATRGACKFYNRQARIKFFEFLT